MPLPSPDKFRGVAKLLNLDVDEIITEFKDAVQQVELITITKDGKEIEVPVPVAIELCGKRPEVEGGPRIGGQGWLPRLETQRQVIRVKWQENVYYVPLLSVPQSAAEALALAAKL